jgi:alanine racemase
LPLATWVEVDLDRFEENLGTLRAAFGTTTDLLLVAKADAYGHGAVEMARAAEGAGVRHIGVATLHEGIQLRASGSRANLWVLSPLLESEIPEAVAYRLEPTLSNLAVARRVSEESLRHGQASRAHIEVDTGMGRTGVDPDEAIDFLEAVHGLEGVRVGSVYTHFPEADAADASFTGAQWERFLALVGELERRGLRPPLVHAANSAAAIRFPELRADLVRIGLAAYGHRPPNAGVIPLEPVMALKSRLVQVRHLPAGRSISYGRTALTSRPTVMGVVPVGYGHGYSWLCSNRGSMLVRGRRAPILGRVTMDLTMVDLTDHGDVAVGDEVVLFGRQGNAELALEEVATWSETLPYEILCTIGKRVSRIYSRDGRPWKVTTLVGERQRHGIETVETP